MKIGVPLETRPGEARVASTPEVVKKFAAKGFEVLVERGAGVRAGYPDTEYEAAGARVTDRAGAYDTDLLLKVRRPDAADVAAMRQGGIYIGLMEGCGEDEMVAAMRAKGIRVLAIAPSLFATGLTKGIPDEFAVSLTKDAAFPKRLGRPEEFAKLVAAIVDNPMLNGQCLRLDAGQRFGPKL